MEEEFKSEGHCIYCKQLYSQKEIGKHLAKHLAELERADAGKNAQSCNHIVVEADEMFLHMLVLGDTPMKKIDSFLKDIWLECCGHMSAFGHKNFKVGMNHKVEDVFAPKVKIYHDYDFGTTTRVFLKALKSYKLKLKDKLILLSRNEPFKFKCATCKTELAVNLCSTCNWEKYSFFCEPCSTKHEEVCDDFSDYSCMPVVNSPRMGECGYTGGTIDIERDGPNQKYR
ncbi:MAG: hypothetical protein Q8S54_17020 [Bacteroidota bacterium]|nr:hypothetical protein [Odoribacter sp.]MDP3644871.1 hypothetical protein [Bacteroidota bacterium]